ncbi:MAG: 2-oxo acid dehydrogenase subunit E2 [Acidimicrobiia bacterium]
MTEEIAPEPAPVWRTRKRRPRAGVTFVSPAVRRVIAERDLDPAQLRGTGGGGRITRADALTANQHETVFPSATGSDTAIPFSPLRRRAARRLLESKATAAHAHVIVECDYARLDRVRRHARLTYLPFVARAIVDALREFPACNGTTNGDAITRHEHVHLGIAVDLDHEDLVVPVAHDADTLRLRPLGQRIGEVAQRARDGKLRPDDVTGGTFTITNPGPFGTILSAPVINFPQVAILTTDAVRPRLVVVRGTDGTDAVAIHPVGMLSVGFDHRAVDLATASGFLARVRDLIEERDWTSEL